MALAPRELWEFLSGLSADELRFAILADDAKTVSKAPGIGKKTAQKLILELRDKLSLEEAFEQKLSHETAGIVVSSDGMTDAKREAVEALTALGYSSTEAYAAVRSVAGVDLENVEEILKAALKNF